MNTNTSRTFDFYCYGCGTPAVARERGMRCPACGEPFSVRALAEPPRALFEEPPASLWHYAPLLPVENEEHRVSIGEGATPLLDAPALAGHHGFGRVLLKNETGNPTGSFKDRQISVGLSHAREIGCGTVAVVSSGNVACATAAYAARAGMEAVLFMHGHAAPGKLAQAAAYGARTFHVDVPSAQQVFDLCLEACGAFGWYHLSTAGMYEPYNVEGAKTIAYELYQQTGGDLPDWVVAPVGGGGLLGGIWRGFLDLQRLGLIDRPPRLAGVQASGCAPLKRAVDHGESFLQSLENPWPDPHTVAGGIADDVLFDGHTVLPAIRSTGGAALAVDDGAILAGELRLAATEGILCEPTAAVVVAGLEKLPDAGADTTVCCIVTGTGIKDLDVIRPHVAQPQKIEPSLAVLQAKMEGAS